jgi:alkylation response protein AidB-like acyl-CoA dehydrogenase
MNSSFDLDTHRMLSDAIDGFALPNASRTRAARDAHAGNDPAIWRQFASMGWIAASRPEQEGGLGMGLRAGAIISQRLGYAGFLEPYVASSVMVVECLSACGPGALSLLKQVVDGNVIAVLAWQSDGGRIEPQAASVTVTEVDGSTVLSGTCRYVAAAGDVFLVFAYGSAVPYIFRVPALRDGLVVEREKAADGTVLTWLKLDKVSVLPEDLLASGTSALAAMEESLACGIVASAKARASQAALYIAGQSVQLHGAIGFTDEYELGIYVNRALTLVPRYGNAAQHRQIYAVTAAE